MPFEDTLSVPAQRRSDTVRNDLSETIGRPACGLGVIGRGILVALGGLWLAACAPAPEIETGGVLRPHERPMNPPAGTLAVDGLRIMDRIEARDRLTNPLPGSDDVLADGKKLYGIYCEMCHGTSGTGDGKVAEYFRRMPDLSAPYVQRYEDGWLYTILREGGLNMPAYASSLSVDERWAVVHHIRTFGSNQ